MAAVSWYSISMAERVSNSAFFNGYFSVTNSNNSVTSFYNASDITFSNNLLITSPATFTNTNGIHNNTTSNNLFYTSLSYYGANQQNIFPVGGTTISSIPDLDQQYSATEWALWSSRTIPARLSYYSNGSWNDIINIAYVFTINPISDPSCFNEGTKILCLNKNLQEEYIPIENLRKGDLVKSYKHGYRKIDLIGKNVMVNNPEKFSECMYKMEKNETNGILEDLIVTGWHSVLVDDLGSFKEKKVEMVDDKYLLVSALSKQFIKLENTNLYTYYHFILENNGNDDQRFGVWANGVLTESASKNHFINHKFILL